MRKHKARVVLLELISTGGGSWKVWRGPLHPPVDESHIYTQLCIVMHSYDVLYNSTVHTQDLCTHSYRMHAERGLEP